MEGSRAKSIEAVAQADAGVVQKEARRIAFASGGHPVWAAMHPSAHEVAIFSGVLQIINLDDGCVELTVPRCATAAWT